MMPNFVWGLKVWQTVPFGHGRLPIYPGGFTFLGPRAGILPTPLGVHTCLPLIKAIAVGKISQSGKSS